MTAPPVWMALATLSAVWLMMLGEAWLSAFNERVLRARGAVEVPDDGYRWMRWAYPGGFALMAIEGALTRPGAAMQIVAGLFVFGLAKALKFWAIFSLGLRWSFRVLVLPGEPLVVSGPYRIVRHPNYLAVLGEIAGVALVLDAFVAGAIFLIGFGGLMLRRIRIEEAALGAGRTAPDRRGR